MTELRTIQKSSSSSDEESITAEEERVLVALRRHMSHNEAAVVAGVARCLHAADANVADRHRLQVGHCVLFLQAWYFLPLFVRA